MNRHLRIVRKKTVRCTLAPMGRGPGEGIENSSVIFRTILILTALALTAIQLPTAEATDWIFMPSTYSHDPQTGQRVTQYAPVEPVLVEVRSDYVKSGYRHTQSRIRVGGSSDNLHITEEWGRPVRPYGEWQHPFRPYSVPYDLWGPPIQPWGAAPWGDAAAYGPYGSGDGYGPIGPGYRPGDDRGRHPDGAPGSRPGKRARKHAERPLRGDDGYPGTFFDRPTTDHEFFWPRPRDPERRGTSSERPPGKPPATVHPHGTGDG